MICSKWGLSFDSCRGSVCLQLIFIMRLPKAQKDGLFEAVWTPSLYYLAVKFVTRSCDAMYKGMPCVVLKLVSFLVWCLSTVDDFTVVYVLFLCVL